MGKMYRIQTTSQSFNNCFYIKSTVLKKNGKNRVIYAPSDKLKEYQKEISNILESGFSDILNSSHIMGFVKQKSIVDNATKHLGKDWVINIDIKDFFPNIKGQYVYDLISKRSIIFSDFISKYNSSLIDVVRLLTLKDKLIQGSPASPIVANLIGAAMIDNKVKDFLDCYALDDLDYTRYADDLTISFNSELKKHELKDIIHSLKKSLDPFQFTKKKTIISSRYDRQEVTGITVNNTRCNLGREKRNSLRGWIHSVIQSGRSIKDDQRLMGHLSYLRYVNPESYNRLIKKYS